MHYSFLVNEIVLFGLVSRKGHLPYSLIVNTFEYKNDFKVLVGTTTEIDDWIRLKVTQLSVLNNKQISINILIFIKYYVRYFKQSWKISHILLKTADS